MKRVATMCWQLGTIALLCCSMIFMQACSTSWITEAESIVEALLPATSNLFALAAALKGSTVSAADLQLIQNATTQATNDLQLLDSLIAQYNAATAADKPGLIAQIQSTAQLVEANLNGILPALHITDQATVTKVTEVVSTFLAEVNSLVALIPIVSPSSSVAMVALATRQAVKTPPLSADDFVVAYNKVMTAKTGNANVDRATAKLAIHRHPKWERWATGGILK